MFTAALLIVAKMWKEPKATSVGEWLNQLGIYPHNGITHML